MNMHLPQNVLAETELRLLAATSWQIISPSGNSPLIGIYQDSLLGAYRFTRPSDQVKMSQMDAMNLLMSFPRVNVDELRKAGKAITNFDVLSQILPPLTLKYQTKLFDKSEDRATSNNILEIRNGKYVRGQIEKSVIATTTKGILHRICNDYGLPAAGDFIDDFQGIITEYMKTSSFSVGVSDLIANRKTYEQISQAINAQLKEVQELMDKVHMGIYENNTSNTNMVQLETDIGNILNKANGEAGKIGRDSLSKDNRFLMIVNSGSKGSLVNISQMISCLGQTSVEGKRVQYGFDSRTLPHYSKFDDSPAARGFIQNSYISGLTAPELFFHAMGGRIGLIDTAVKTSQTGYIQRRLIKGLEDLKVVYDMTVRDNRGKIIQYAYGEDGFDSTSAETQLIPLVNMSVEDVYMHYDIMGVNDQRSDLLNVYTKSTVARLKRQANDTAKKCADYIHKMLENRELLVENVFGYKNTDSVQVPVSFQNIIANIQGQLELGPMSAVDITPLEAFNMIEKYFERLKKYTYAAPTALFEILYFYYLSPKDLLVNKRFHEKGLELLLETICLRYKKSLVSPGEMVGVIAGQSIGEPTTQLTLNSVTYETEIVVRNANHEIQKIQIGDFVQMCIDNASKIEYMQDKDTTYAEISADSHYYEVPCATEDGLTVWRRIEAGTKHPVVNLDGTNTMIKVTTEGNREVIATKAKSFLQLVDGKIVGVEGKDLRVGDYLPVSKKPLEYKENCLNEQSYMEGYEYFNMNRSYSDCVFKNSEFICGFVSGLLDSEKCKFNDCIEIGEEYSNLLHLHVMLKNAGVWSTIENNGNVLTVKNRQIIKLYNFTKNKHIEPYTEISYTYEYDKSFLTVPNIVDGKTTFDIRGSRYEDTLFDKIVKIEDVENTTPYAYDLTVEDTRNFDCYNGLSLIDTFHLAGVASKSNVTRGVPRIEEILRLTKNPKKPSLTVFLKPIDEGEQSKAETYANMLEHTKLVDVVKSAQIYFDPQETATVIEQDRHVVEQFYEFEKMVSECNDEATIEEQKSKWVVRLEIDAEAMLEKNLTMDDIHFAVKTAHGNDITCCYSDFNEKNLVFRIRLNSDAFRTKKARSNMDQTDEIYVLKNFQDSILNNIVLRGITGIENVLPRKLQNMVSKEDGKFVTKNSWILDTTGSNLIDVLGQDYIDSSRTYSNDIREIYETLGIEAARQAIYNEMVDVMTSDVYINYHHLSVLCDRMTASKDLIPIFRSGILKDNIGPIAKATFEVHTEVFLDAARHADFDPMRGVSANVMCGQQGYYGTNAFNMILDIKEMSKLKEVSVDTRTEQEEIERLFHLGDNSKDECSAKNITIRNNFTAIREESVSMCNDEYDVGI